MERCFALRAQLLVEFLRRTIVNGSFQNQSFRHGHHREGDDKFEMADVGLNGSQAWPSASSREKSTARAEWVRAPIEM